MEKGFMGKNPNVKKNLEISLIIPMTGRATKELKKWTEKVEMIRRLRFSNRGNLKLHNSLCKDPHSLLKEGVPVHSGGTSNSVLF